MAKKRFMGINPAHKGYCTPMTKSTCTPKRKALAKTLKKHHGFHKAEDGFEVMEPKGPVTLAPAQDPLEFSGKVNPYAQPQAQDSNRQFPWWQMGYYPGLTQEFAENAREDRQLMETAGSSELAGQYKRRAQANDAGAVGAGLQSVFNGVKAGVGAWGAVKSFQQGKLAEQESFNLHNRERAAIKPYRGTNDSPVMLKHGGELPIGTAGTHFAEGPHNIEDEVDETVAIPPDGVNPGAVFVETGRSHEDGGNKRAFPDKTAILSKRLHMKKEDALKAFAGTEVADRIATEIDKDIISHAELGALYDTKELAEEKATLTKGLVKLAKKKEKVAQSQTLEPTKVSQVTAKISNMVLKDKAKIVAEGIKAVDDEMAYNSDVVRNVLLPKQEAMKEKGMYGKKVQDGGEAKYGKKVKLPKASTGGKYDIPYEPDEGKPNLDDFAYEAQPNGDDLPYGFIPPTTSVTSTSTTAPVVAPSTTQSVTSTPKFTPFQTKNKTNPASVITPTGFNVEANKKSDIDWINEAYDINKYGPVPEFSSEEIKTYGLDPKDTATIDNARLQRAKYRQAMSTPEGQNSILRMMARYAETNRGEDLGISIPVGDLTQIKDPVVREKLIKDFERAFVDGKALFRMPATGKAITPKGPVTPKGDDPIGKMPSVTLKNRKKGNYYQEGLYPWQVAGEFATLFDPYEPAPYIEDHGAADALAASNRPQLVSDQAGHNRITRGLKAATRYSPQNASFNAQVASNAWEAHNNLTAQTAATNAQQEEAFQQRQNQMRMAAGANKAKALDLLATRTAKGHSAWTNRNINAISAIGNKMTHNLAENRAALLIQDMFPDLAYNPWTGTSFRGGSTLRSPGTDLDPQTKEEYQLEIAKLKAEAAAKKAESKKYGGKAKLPKKSPMSGRSVKC